MKPFGLLFIAASIAANAQYQPNWDSIDKRPTPAWFTEAKFGIFIHWGVYSVPAYAPVIPGKLAYAEWYWNAMTNGQGPKANPIQAGTWAYHQKQYGADFPYNDFAPQFRAELFDPDHWADVFTPLERGRDRPQARHPRRPHRCRPPYQCQNGLLLFAL